MQFGLADKICDWAIFAVRAYATLPFDLQIAPFVGGDSAENERVIVTADVGEQMDSGPEPFQCRLAFEFRTVTRTANDANDVFAKIEAALANSLQVAAGVTYATPIFTWLQIFPENAETTLSNSGNFRIYTRTIPLRAKSA